MCITPTEFVVRLGDFDQYCPVALADTEELVDCSTTRSLKLAVEFRGNARENYAQVNYLFNMDLLLHQNISSVDGYKHIRLL